MNFNVSALNSLLLEKYPAKWAADWDIVGLINGDPDKPVHKILLAVDLESDVIAEATKLKADAIVTHHPPYLKPPAKLILNQVPGKYFRELIKHDIAYIAMHTNVDSAPEGLNFFLGRKIGLKNISLYNPESKTRYFKFVVFVPVSHLDQIIEAIHKGGGGWIGNYSHCTFRTEGTGTFRPLEGTNPYIGKQGEVENVNEFRVETIVPATQISNLITEVINAHPYEEVAYDVYPLEINNPECGLGITGIPEKDESVETLSQIVKKAIGVKNVQIIIKNEADMKHKAGKVLICTGAGGSLIRSLNKSKCDIFITGEAGYHDLIDAKEKGIVVILGGHYATEAIFPEMMELELKKHPIIAENKIEIVKSSTMQDPIYYR